jgi:hypothetical protein
MCLHIHSSSINSSAELRFAGSHCSILRTSCASKRRLPVLEGSRCRHGNWRAKVACAREELAAPVSAREQTWRRGAEERNHLGKVGAAPVCCVLGIAAAEQVLALEYVPDLSVRVSWGLAD